MHLLIYAAKAEPIGDQMIDDVKIVIEQEVTLTPEKMAEDAKSIANALHDALPQGTWAKLVAAMAALWSKDLQGHISAPEWYS